MPDSTTLAILDALDAGFEIVVEAFAGDELALRTRRHLDDGRLLTCDRYLAREELLGSIESAIALHLAEARRSIDEAVRIDRETGGGPR